jgi:hypothetical protein
MEGMMHNDPYFDQNEEQEWEHKTERENEELDLAAALEPEEAGLDKLILEVLQAVKLGFSEDPGTSDLDDEQPITVRLTLGEYRKACRLAEAFKEENQWPL